VFTGQDVSSTALQVVIATMFGAVYFFARRQTGWLAGAIVLHGVDSWTVYVGNGTPGLVDAVLTAGLCAAVAASATWMWRDGRGHLDAQ
jgi:hypothetical protein